MKDCKSGSSGILDIEIPGGGVSKFHSSLSAKNLTSSLGRVPTVCGRTISSGGHGTSMDPCLGKTDGDNFTAPFFMTMSTPNNNADRHQASGVSSGASVTPFSEIRDGELVLIHRDVCGEYDSTVVSVGPVVSRKKTISYNHVTDMMKKGLLHVTTEPRKSTTDYREIICDKGNRGFHVDLLDYCKIPLPPKMSAKKLRAYNHQHRKVVVEEQMGALDSGREPVWERKGLKKTSENLITIAQLGAKPPSFLEVLAKSSMRRDFIIKPCTRRPARWVCGRRWRLYAQGSFSERPPAVCKFAKGLVSGRVSYGDQLGYWRCAARMPMHQLLKFARVIDRKFRHDLSTKEQNAYAGSLRRFKSEFSTPQRELLLEAVRTLEAQALFTIKHEVDCSAMIDKIGEIFDQSFGGSAMQKWRGRIVRYAMFIFEMISNSSWSSKVRSAVSTFSDLDFGHIGLNISNYVKLLSEVFRGGVRNTELVAQGMEDGSTQENIVQSTVRLLCALFEAKGPQELRLETVRVNRLVNLTKVIRGSSTILEYLGELISYCKELIESHVLGLTTSDLQLKQISADIPAWMIEVGRIYNNEGLARVNGDRALAERVKQLKEKGDEFHKILVQARLRFAATVSFQTVYKQVDDLYRASVPNQFADSYRKTPFSIYLFGASGVGKSMLQKALTAHLLAHRETPYDPSRDLFTRNMAQDHWDGYHNQKVVLFDDFMQVTDDEHRRNCLGEIINIVNHVAYPLKMAALDNKGTTRFTSELVMFTSNMNIDHTVQNLVRDLGAIKRRRNVVVQVRVLRPFLNDVGHIDPALAGNGFNPGIYIFDVLDSVTDRVVARGINYQQLFSYCAQRWTELDKKFENVEDISQFVANYPTPSIVDLPESLEAQGLFSSKKPSLDVSDQMVDMEVSRIVDRILSGEDVEDDVLEFLSLLDEERSKQSKSIFDRARDKWDEIIQHSKNFSRGCSVLLDSITSKMRAHPWLTALGTLSAVVIGLGGLLMCMGSRDECEAEASVSGDERTRKKMTSMRIEASVSGDEKTRKKTLRMITESDDTPETILADDLISQGSTDPQMLDIINSVVCNNIAIVDVEGVIMNAMGICDTIFAIPLHAFARSDIKQADVSISMKGNFTVRFNTQDCEMHIVEEKDLVFVRIPRKLCPPVRDIRNHFHCDEDVSKYQLEKGMIANLMKGGSGARVVTLQTLQQVRPKGQISYVHRANGEEEKLSIVNGYTYKAETQGGSCGGPILWNQSCVSKKILGFHVAGGVGHGACTAVTGGLLNKYVGSFPNIISVECPMLTAQSCMRGAIQTGDNVQYFGDVTPQEQYRVPEKTEIRRSLLHGVFPPVTQPCMLRPKDGIDPMRIGVHKQFNEVETFDQNVVDECVASYTQDVLCLRDTTYLDNARLLTDKEMLMGVPGDRFICPLNLKTSAGFPYNTTAHKTKKKGKMDFVIGEEGDYELTPEMMASVREREEKARRGVAAFTLWCDTLKDERRPIAKVLSGKTRVFNIGPIEFNLLCRKYFAFFSAHLYANCIYGECSTGVNAHSSDWGELLEHLKEKGSQFLAGDFSNYDKSLSWQLLRACLDVINTFYADGEENSRVREVLFVSMFSAFHLCGRRVYRVCRGNPSGCVITVQINSMCNSLISRITYLLIGRQLNLNVSMSSFRRDVRVKNYGDDNLGCVADSAWWYNMQTISDVLRPYGIVYTSASKGDISTPFVTASDLTYLKREFVRRDGRWWAPLARESIQEMVNWIRASNDDEEQTRNNYEGALREMVHYGRREYENFQETVCAYSRSRMPIDRIPYEVSMNYLFENSGLVAQGGSSDGDSIESSDYENVSEDGLDLILEDFDGQDEW